MFKFYRNRVKENILQTLFNDRINKNKIITNIYGLKYKKNIILMIITTTELQISFVL